MDRKSERAQVAFQVVAEGVVAHLADAAQARGWLAREHGPAEGDWSAMPRLPADSALAGAVLVAIGAARRFPEHEVLWRRFALACADGAMTHGMARELQMALVAAQAMADGSFYEGVVQGVRVGLQASLAGDGENGYRCSPTNALLGCALLHPQAVLGAVVAAAIAQEVAGDPMADWQAAQLRRIAHAGAPTKLGVAPLPMAA